MKYEPIELRCECGCPPVRIHNVGFTASRQLVVFWRCLACRKSVYVVKDVVDVWPEIMTIKGKGASEENIRDLDRRFLESLGIRPA